MRRTPSDYELTLRVREGDEWAFEELMRRHSDVLFFNANQFSAPGQEREDMEQRARIGLLTAARTFKADRGSSFRNFAQIAIRAELITAFVAAGRQKHRALNEAVSLEIKVGDEGSELGELLPAPASADPCEIVIQREDFARDLRVLTVGCTPIERTVVARRLNGLKLAAAGAGIGTASDPAKTADNALGRVRRKLAAAA